ncbi:hypothetical protein ACYQR9_02740 [Methylobacterium sp. CM6241]
MTAKTPTKPKPSSKLRPDKMAPEWERPRPPGKNVEPLTPTEQGRRFEELSRELGTDNGEMLDRVFGKIVPAKTVSTEKSRG